MKKINKKKIEIDEIRSSRDLDLLLKIRHRELACVVLAINLREK